jgi:hypothetical protein
MLISGGQQEGFGMRVVPMVLAAALAGLPGCAGYHDAYPAAGYGYGGVPAYGYAAPYRSWSPYRAYPGGTYAVPYAARPRYYGYGYGYGPRDRPTPSYAWRGPRGDGNSWRWRQGAEHPRRWDGGHRRDGGSERWRAERARPQAPPDRSGTSPRSNWRPPAGLSPQARNLLERARRGEL